MLTEAVHCEADSEADDVNINCGRSPSSCVRGNNVWIGGESSGRELR